MNRVILCTMTRNHLRFLIPMIENLCKNNNEVILFTSVAEISNDSISHRVNFLRKIYSDTFFVMDVSNEKELIYLSNHANSLLVTSGTSNQYHRTDYELCKKVHCKSFAIQHGISQEAITRLTHYEFSADYVFTWIKKSLIPECVSTPRDKFISVGVPNHYYEKTEKIEDSKIFFLSNGFDKPNNQDIKLDTSKGEWSGIYTLKWKEETWNKMRELSNGPCYFVRHPVSGGDIHPALKDILKCENNFLVDNNWLKRNNLNRSQLYSLGSKYYVTYPSSCFIDCLLNDVDYEVFIDYNGKVKIFTEDSLKGINSTNEICKVLLE